MARCGKGNDHTKSGQILRRGQYQIQHVMMLMIWHQAIPQEKPLKVFDKNRVQVMEYPGNSPDLNPIEAIWGIIKFWLRKMDCTTIRKLVADNN